MESYDENLQDNLFFTKLCHLFPTLYQDAPHHQWLICVPRSGTIDVGNCIDDDFQCHILQPLNPLQTDGSYCTLNRKVVSIVDNKIYNVDEETNEIDADNFVKILFEELFYHTPDERFRVLCTEGPLQGKGCDCLIKSLNSVADCVKFLKREVSDENILNEVDYHIKSKTSIWNQYKHNDKIEGLINVINNLLQGILGIILQFPPVAKRCSRDKAYNGKICLALESYTIHMWGSELMQIIVNMCATQDSNLNRLIQKFSDVEYQDLEVKAEFCEAIGKCRQELGKINSVTTPLTKKLCLKRAFQKMLVNYGTKQSMMSADEVLPLFICLILKTPVYSWYAQLTFMKNIGASSSGEIWEHDFYLATLEAALEHITSGGLNYLNESKWLNYIAALEVGIVKDPSLEVEPSEQDLENAKILFKLAKKGVVYELEEFAVSIIECGVRSKDMQDLCHPLCYCQSCTSKTRPLLSFSKLLSCFRDHHLRSALSVAVAFAREEVVDYLLQHSTNINTVDADGISALHLACRYGLQRILMQLLDYGADLALKDHDDNTALHYAASSGHKHCVQTLLYCDEHLGGKLDVNGVNASGDTALHLAARYGFVDVVELLMQFGANISIQNKSKQTVMDVAHSDYIKMVLNHHQDGSKFKIKKQLSVSSPVNLSNGQPSLGEADKKNVEVVNEFFTAVVSDDLKLVCKCLRISTDIVSEISVKQDEAESEHKSEGELCHPLCQCDHCLAILQSKLGIWGQVSKMVTLYTMKLLNSYDAHGTTAVHLASALGHKQLLKLFLACGVSINTQDAAGATPLHLAVRNNQIQIVELLLNNQASVNMTDAQGDTPLHYATSSGLTDVSALLIKEGADVNQKNFTGNVPSPLPKENIQN